MLRKFNRGASESVWDIFAGDKTWIKHYDPESKRQSLVCVRKINSLPLELGGPEVRVRKWLAPFSLR